MAFTTARWVWVDREGKADTYGEFYEEFFWEEGEVNCLLSCDGDYTLFVNGQYVSSNQYGDFEWYKSYDLIDLTPYLQKGNNTFAVLVWHFGVDTQRSIKAQAGLIFEVKMNISGKNGKVPHTPPNIPSTISDLNQGLAFNSISFIGLEI